MFREKGILLDLYEDEKILTVIRRHWFSFLGTIIATIVLLIVFLMASILVYTILKNSDTTSGALYAGVPLISQNLGKGAFIVLSPIYLLAVLGFFYISWLDYYLDVFVLTNKRILRFEQLVLFGQKVSETSFQHVQDVSSQVKGFVQTILNIGTVFIETAGENENFAFTPIKDPGGVATEILELQKKMWEEDKMRSDLDEDKIISKMEEIHQEEMAGDKQTVDKKIFGGEEKIDKIIEPKIEKPILFNQSSAGQVDQAIKEVVKEAICDIPVAPVIERKEVVIEKKEIIKPKKEVYKNGVYKDGRKIIPDGVIWQSEQELTEDVLDTLNQMDE